ncbi:MAG TPA: hypothetical protein VGV89_00125 [Thermoplasmata archaeon]|nr:hypothetical protein [Thermoplasmata archaeon]
MSESRSDSADPPGGAASQLWMGRPAFKVGRMVLLAFAVLLLLVSLPGIGVTGRAVPGEPSALALSGDSALNAARAMLGATGGPAPAPPARAYWNLSVPSFSGAQGLMVWDASDGYVVLFQGFHSNVSNPTWTFSRGTWSQAVSPNAPSGRIGAVMAYDPGIRKVVLFGGATDLGAGGGDYLNDTWTFHAGVWTNVSARSPAAPAPRAFPAMAFDPTGNRLIVFGGTTHVFCPTAGCPGTTYQDTWAFSNNVWTALSTRGAPSPRYGAALAPDPSAKAMLLFGGAICVCRPTYTNATIDYNDSWTFAAGRWTALSVGHAPSPRWGSTLIYDPAIPAVLLIGGMSRSVYASPRPADAWALTSTGWAPLTVPQLPASRTLPPSAPLVPCPLALSYDPATSSVLLLGIPLWSFNGTNWSSIGTSPTPAATGYPDYPLMTYDAADRYVVLLELNHTWKFQSDRWSRLAPGPTWSGWPYWASDTDAAMTYDAHDGYVLFFGGYYTNSTWSFVGGVWTQLSPSHPPPSRFGASLTYDPVDGYVLLYGGRTCSPGLWSPSICRDLSDTWTYSGGHWSLLAPTAGVSPGGREGAGFVWDGRDGYAVLYGGARWPNSQGSWSVLNDTWNFSNGRWTNITRAPSPGHRVYGNLAYDPVRRAVVLFGGEGAYAWPNSTWVFRGGHWSVLVPANRSIPHGWGLCGWVFVPALRQVLLFDPEGEVWLLRVG